MQPLTSKSPLPPREPTHHPAKPADSRASASPATGANFADARNSENGRRLQELETENARLRELLAEAELDEGKLRDIALGNW